MAEKVVSENLSPHKEDFQNFSGVCDKTRNLSAAAVAGTARSRSRFGLLRRNLYLFLEVAHQHLAGDRASNRGSPAAVLHKDRNGDLRVLDRRETDEDGVVFPIAARLRRAGFGGYRQAGDAEAIGGSARL